MFRPAPCSIFFVLKKGKENFIFFLFTVTLLFEGPRKDYFKTINSFKIL